MDSLQADSDFYFQIFENLKLWAAITIKKKKKQDSGTHDEVKYVALSNVDLKQLTECSHSESDKYTESRMKETVSHVVSPDFSGNLSYFIPVLG